MNIRHFRTPLLGSLLVLMAACSTTANRDKLAVSKPQPQPAATPTYGPTTYSGVFAKPAALEPAVDFWRKTYAVWRRSEVAIHDDRSLDVVYEVMTLPGYVGEGLTNQQKDIMTQRKEFWKAQLSSLENKMRYNAPLNAADQQILAKIDAAGKSPAKFINGASDRVRTQRGTKERFKRGLEISGRYDLQFRKIFREAGLPEDLAYLPHVESSYQLNAKSSAGAVGVWQFTKVAAQTFMPGHESVEHRSDPFIAANGAARYLTHAYSKLGNWPAAVTSYNHGIGGMKRAQNNMGNDFNRIVDEYDGPAFGFASRNYYAQFLAAREIANNPHQYFSEGVAYEAPVSANQYLASR